MDRFWFKDEPRCSKDSFIGLPAPYRVRIKFFSFTEHDSCWGDDPPGYWKLIEKSWKSIGARPLGAIVDHVQLARHPQGATVARGQRERLWGKKGGIVWN